MSKLRYSQEGFSAVEALLILVIVGIVGFVGWYVYQARSKANQTFANTTKSQGEAQKTTSNTSATSKPTDPAANWLKYTSQNSKYSVAIPDGWHLTATKGDDSIIAWSSTDIPFVPGKPAQVDVVEGGRDGGSVAFYLIYDYTGNQSSYTSANLKKVKTYTTANGVTVDKYTRTQTTEPEGMDIPKGTTEYAYNLTSTGKKTIRITHDVLPGETDQTQHIEDAIATLKFL